MEQQITTVSEKEAIERLKTAEGANKSSGLTIFYDQMSYEEISNSEEKLMVIPAESRRFPEVDSRILLLKIDGEMQHVLFNMVPDGNSTDELFSGKMFITDLTGNFQRGYRVEKGILISRFVQNKSRRKSCDPTYGSNICEGTLDEVIIEGEKDNSIPIDYVFIIRADDECDMNCSGEEDWNYGGGRGNEGEESTNGTGPCEGTDGANDSVMTIGEGGCGTLEEVRIINELEGKADCVYQKMVDNNNNINWILENFEDGDKPSEFNLKFQLSTTLGAATNASTIKSGNTFIIKINANRVPFRTSLSIARTILHEGVHARLKEFASRNGSNATKFPGVYDYFRKYGKNWDHQQMADYYRETIAEGLRQYDNGQHSWQFYKDLAWEGLAEELRDQNNPDGNSTFTTQAWNDLSLSEQNRIKNTIRDEKENGNKNCE